MLASSLTLTAFATSKIPDGGEISVTAKTGDGVSTLFTHGSGSDKYTGTCVQMGLPHSSGDFTATKLSNNSKYAKIAYYYGEVKGWWHETSGGSSIIPGAVPSMGKNNVVMLMLQAENQGHSNWKNICTSGGYFSADGCDVVLGILDDTNWNSINVPDNFEIYKIRKGSGVQDGMIWRLVPTGHLKLKKVSGRIEITG